MRALTASVCCVVLAAATAGCLHQEYDPALPAPRAFWDNSPLVPVTPPPVEAVEVSPVPPQEEWEAFQRGEPMRTPVRPAPVERVTSQFGVMRRYPYTPGTVYTVQTTPSAPTYLMLPLGERLAAPPVIDPEVFALGLVQTGVAEQRREVVVLRALQPTSTGKTGLIFQSGLVIFCHFTPATKPDLLAVTWDLEKTPLTPRGPVVSKALRPPMIDRGRLFTQYTIEIDGKTLPPWMPVAAFDDGTRTYIRFQEALTYTRAPGVFGVNTKGGPMLVQSHMYTIPGQPEKGAWLLVQGLWPALRLKDGPLAVLITRQSSMLPNPLALGR